MRRTQNPQKTFLLFCHNAILFFSTGTSIAIISFVSGTWDSAPPELLKLCIQATFWYVSSAAFFVIGYHALDLYGYDGVKRVGYDPQSGRTHPVDIIKLLLSGLLFATYLFAGARILKAMISAQEARLITHV